MSHMALGKPLRNERHRDIWSGVSVQEKLIQSQNQAKVSRGNQFVGIAILEIPESVDIRAEKTTNQEGHFTLWAEPEELLRYMREVVELSE